MSEAIQTQYERIIEALKGVDPHGRVEVLTKEDMRFPTESGDEVATPFEEEGQTEVQAEAPIVEDDFLIGVDNVYVGLKIEDIEGLEDGEVFNTFIYRTVLSAIIDANKINDAPPAPEEGAILEDNEFVPEEDAISTEEQTQIH